MPTIYVLSRIFFFSQFENCQFLEVKFSIYLNRCVFVMGKKLTEDNRSTMSILDMILSMHKYSYINDCSPPRRFSLQYNSLSISQTQITQTTA